MRRYKIYKLESAEVGELLRAWMEDVCVSRMTRTLSDKFGLRTQPVRAALAERNRRASDALWADDYLAARDILLRDGLCDSFESANTAQRKEVRKTQKKMRALTLGRGVDKVERQKINGTHWGTVK